MQIYKACISRLYWEFQDLVSTEPINMYVKINFNLKFDKLIISNDLNKIILFNYNNTLLLLMRIILIEGTVWL